MSVTSSVSMMNLQAVLENTILIKYKHLNLICNAVVQPCKSILNSIPVFMALAMNIVYESLTNAMRKHPDCSPMRAFRVDL